MQPEAPGLTHRKYDGGGCALVRAPRTAGTPMLQTFNAAPQAANTTVLFFGAVGDQLGRSHRLHLPPGGVSASELRRLLSAQLPQAEAALTAPGVRMAVDKVLTAGDVHVQAGAEVAFFSAFSGG